MDLVWYDHPASPGPHPWIGQHGGLPPVHALAQGGDGNLSRLEEFIAEGRNIHEEFSICSWLYVTPLSLAARNGAEALVSLLLRAGARPAGTPRTDPLEQALIWAPGPGTARLLLDAGVRPQTRHYVAALRGLGFHRKRWPRRAAPVRSAALGRLGLVLSYPRSDDAGMERLLAWLPCIFTHPQPRQELEDLFREAPFRPARAAWIGAVIRVSSRAGPAAP